MALTDLNLRKAKGREKPYRMSDERGLYVLVQPSGAVWWRFDYIVDGKRKTMSFGVYPDVSLSDARTARDEARKLVAKGIDPIAVSEMPRGRRPKMPTIRSAKQSRITSPTSVI